MTQPIFPTLGQNKGWFPLTRFWLRTLTHENFNHLNKIEARYKGLRLNVKLSEVYLLRSCIASILFANVNFAHVYTRKNYATVEINPKAHHKAGPTLALKSQIIMAILSSSRADERVGAE